MAFLSRTSPYGEELDGTHFRLLRLQAGATGTKIACTLEVYLLSGSIPKYEAISYVCGALSNYAEIECNGVPFRIRPSLCSALERFRMEEQDRLLWADQVCINQISDRERSAQVNIMKNVFVNAEQVLMWLGPCEQQYLTLFEQLMRSMLNCMNQYPELTFLQTPSDEELRTCGLPARHSNQWKALKLFSENAYFKRIWVVQEVSLARKAMMVWGDMTCSWNEIRTIFVWAMSYVVGFVDHCSYCLLARHLVLDIGQSPLGELIEDTRDLEASDDRDKVFALLGLLKSDSGSKIYEANYTKSTQQIGLEVTRYVIEEEQNLRILGDVQHKSDDIPSRGSWGVDLSNRNNVSPLLRTHDFNASKAIPLTLSSLLGSSSLSLHGLLVARIHHRIAVFEEHSNFQSICNAWQLLKLSGDVPDLCKLARDFIWTLAAGHGMQADGLQFQNADESLLMEFCKYMIWLQLMDGTNDEFESYRELLNFSAQAYKGYPQQSKGNLREVESATNINLSVANAKDNDAMPAKLSPTGIIADPRGFQLLSASALHLRALIYLADGKIGLGPRFSQNGDLIAVLFGGKTPFVIRPTDTTGEYLFIGECYIEDYMDGQGIDMMERGDVFPELITLR